MRCREARKRIEKGELQNSELLRHLEICPDCDRLAQAAGLLKQAISKNRADHESAEDIPLLSFVRSRVEAHTAKPYRKEFTFMSFMSLFANHRRFTVSAGIVIGLLIVFTVVPFSYKKPVGYEVVIPVENKAIAAVSLTELTRALNLLGYDETSVNYNVNNKTDKTYVATEGDVAVGDDFLHGELVISGLPDEDAARKAGVLFVTMSGTDAKPEVKIVMRDVTGSLYAAIKNKLINNSQVQISFYTDGMTDEEISEDILMQLAARGFQVADIKTTVTPDGDKAVEIRLEQVPDSAGE
ncbi:MAG: zf-HC2 domain-containing protein [Candidatus Zixiibacteriota bacterium]